MTLPCASLPRLDPVTVGTADDARVPFNLTLNRRDGLERRHVGRLPLHVVNVKRSRVGGVSTVHAPVRHDYDEDTEQQIEDGNAILRAIDTTPETGSES